MHFKPVYCHPNCFHGCVLESNNYTLSFLPARARGPTPATGNTHHTNPRQSACLHCQETGHSSNDCPSQTRHSRNAQQPGMDQQSGKVSRI